MEVTNATVFTPEYEGKSVVFVAYYYFGKDIPNRIKTNLYTTVDIVRVTRCFVTYSYTVKCDDKVYVNKHKTKIREDSVGRKYISTVTGAVYSDHIIERV